MVTNSNNFRTLTHTSFYYTIDMPENTWTVSGQTTMSMCPRRRMASVDRFLEEDSILCIYLAVGYV
jgi:hypothetical protein